MTLFLARGFIYYGHTKGVVNYTLKESEVTRDINELKEFICDFVDNNVVIPWDDQGTLGEYLGELGLDQDLLHVVQGECLINRDIFSMDKARDILQRLQMGFDNYVIDNWDIKFFRFN